jgi:hypothetical protein
LDAFKKKLVPVSSAEIELGHVARTRRTAAASRTGKPGNSISVDCTIALVLKAVVQMAL